MKNIIKMMSAFVMTLAVVLPQGVFAASLNNDPRDFATLRVANYTQNPGSTSSWSQSTSASAGQVVALSIYYHNTTEPTAQNVRLKLTPRTTGNGQTHSFTATVSADNASSVSGSATVTLSSAQTLTFMPGRVYWYANQQGTPTPLPYGQSGEELFANGVNIGDVAYGWATQGSLVVHFLVGNATPVETLSVTTQAATNVSDYSAMLNGYLTTDTANAYRWFEWGTSYSLGNSTSRNIQYSSGSFSQYLPVQPGRTYYYRAVAESQSGRIVYGSIKSFTTTDTVSNQVPSVTTRSATDITETSAVLQGYVNPNGTSDTTRWFEWGTSQSLGNTTSRLTQGSSAGNFSASISGLAPNTTYYFRAVAQNVAGTVYGSTMSFTTTGTVNQAPYVSTKAATNVSENYATLNGYVVPNVSSSGYAANTTRWFEWGTTYSLGNTTGHVTHGTSAGDFSETISGLAPNTTYYFRAVAQNSYGIGYGSILSFTTSGAQITGPTAVTNLATNVVQSSAKLNGLALVNGNISTNAWFEWGTTYSLGNTTPPRSIGNQSSIAFSETITGLSANMTYYYRAVVQNAYGTSRGSILSFTTPGQTVVYQPPVIIQEPPRVITIREPQVVVRTVGVGVTSPIEISIVGLREQVLVNDRITYLIRYENKGSARLTDAVLRVMLPQEMEYLGSSRGSFSTKENTLTVVVGELLPGASGEVTVEARVRPETAVGKVLVTSVVMVYTDTRTNTQGDAIAYAIHTVTDGRNALGASLVGFGFFPDTVIEWFILLILILIIVFLIISIQNSRRRIAGE